MEITFSIRIEPDLPTIVPDTITYETGASVEQTRDPTLYAYEHHGEGFQRGSPGALMRFFEDLCSGRPMPIMFGTRRIQDFDTLFALALFLHRDIATHPSAPGLYASVDMVHRLGDTFLGHLDPSLDRFLRRLRTHFSSGLSKREAGERLKTALEWIHDYVLTGHIPHLGRGAPAPKLIEVGTDGFVVAQSEGPLFDAWVDLYRAGHLRGVVFSQDKDSRRHVLASRKSDLVSFDLTGAARILNDMERAMGELPEWSTDGLWLRSPEMGTLILPSHLVTLLVRV
jgi:hypothetical protein